MKKSAMDSTRHQCTSFGTAAGPVPTRARNSPVMLWLPLAPDPSAAEVSAAKPPASSAETRPKPASDPTRSITCSIAARLST